jgi:rhodanese-related sulfurtransferase
MLHADGRDAEPEEGAVAGPAGQMNDAWERSPSDVAKQLRDEPDSLVLIDCREPDEHRIARIEGAVLVPIGEVGERLDDLRDAAEDGERDVVVYCHHGVRSLRVTAALRQAGLDEAMSMAGGIDRWSVEIDPGVPRY